MLSKTELRDALLQCNVKDLAMRTGLSTKTIYRLRHRASPVGSPSFKTLELLTEAIKAARKARPATKSMRTQVAA
jgi:transcriptional regulator with XRE-family HTH domain